MKDAVNFWESEAGLLERLGLLADQVQLGTYNRAVKTYGSAVGATDFQISGSLSKNSCDWCKMHIGQVYHRGQFMPDLPKHPNCNHFYEVLQAGIEPESPFAKFWALLE